MLIGVADEEKPLQTPREYVDELISGGHIDTSTGVDSITSLAVQLQGYPRSIASDSPIPTIRSPAPSPDGASDRALRLLDTIDAIRAHCKDGKDPHPTQQ